ncbi:hypothetical protein SAMN05216266_11193 [Amycolatopsis marina]|uniref:Uncharacterized protein n=1 Tax=Amycolatopsis marina TaxID=490629 RepID=A0A1I1AZC2_9PSEU|nr:hypothetical protein SAMN05216266_11193 [Amycolatopsis marina]
MLYRTSDFGKLSWPRFGTLIWPHLVRVFVLLECVPAGEHGVVSEREPGPVVTLVWTLDEVFVGFAGRPVEVVREQLEDACEM